MQIDGDTPSNDYQSLLNAKDARPNIPVTDGIDQMTGISASAVTARFAGRPAPGGSEHVSLRLVRLRTSHRVERSPAAEDKYNSDTNTVSLREN